MRPWAVVLTLFIAGCTALPGPIFEPAADAGAPRWPAPPAVGRLAWLGEFRAGGARPRGARPRGARPRGARHRAGYVRPHGVGLSAVAGTEDTVCVADPGARGVWVHAGDRPARFVGLGVLLSPIDCAFLPDARLVVTDSAARAVVAFDDRGRIAWRLGKEELARPTGLAVDVAGGRLWIADAKAHRLLAVDFEGKVTGRVGQRGQEAGSFNFPTALAVDHRGSIYVLDTLNFRVQILSAAGEPRREFGIAGDGPGTFLRPRGIAVDAARRIYVSDALFDNVQIFDLEGRLLLALGRRGRQPGQFSMPAGVGVHPDGRLYVADAYNRRVQVFGLLDAAGEGGP